MDVIYTDVRVTRSKKAAARKLAAFERFQLNEELLAESDAEMTHRLSAYLGEEIIDEALKSERPIAWN